MHTWERFCTMMYKAYSGLLLCSDASSMSEMVWELGSRASLTSRNQFCTLASSYVGLSLSGACSLWELGSRSTQSNDEIVPRYSTPPHTVRCGCRVLKRLNR